MNEKIEAIVKPLINELAVELISVNYYQYKTEWYLEIVIDKDGGVDIDDCVAVTKVIGPAMDEYDPIDESYTLEVVSKGEEPNE